MPMTVEQFVAWWDIPGNEDKRAELVRGEVLELPLCGERHGVVCANAGAMLWGYLRKSRVGYACVGAGVILARNPDTVRCPDVTVYPPKGSYEQLSTSFDDIPPLLAVEVLDEGDDLADASDKIQEYLRAGAGLVWTLDAAEREVSVYRPSGSPLRLAGEDELTGGNVLPGFRCLAKDYFLLPAGRSRNFDWD